jgi:aryl-alcohol dehydrogenase-like predicted oxidoreductase
MKHRQIPNTPVKVSEIGFGMWTISTGWWGKFTEAEAIKLMEEGLGLGVTTFDAADTYGNGLSEELIGKAFAKKRDQIQIATKVGYDFYSHGDERRGQAEIPHNFSIPFIREAVEKALQRLKTDHIDVLQLHNIRMEQVADDALWKLMEDLRKEGKILAHGAALGPAIGWLYEGVDCITKRKPHIVQHIYNMLEQHPGRPMMDAQPDSDTRYFIRVTHSSGMLEGHYTKDTVFPPGDHRLHRPKSWLTNGLKKIETLKPLVLENRTLGQTALQWLLADQRIVTCLPNIYNIEQLREFAQATETPALQEDELKLARELWENNFGVEEEPGKYKGTMTREPAAELANA